MWASPKLLVFSCLCETVAVFYGRLNLLDMLCYGCSSFNCWVCLYVSRAAIVFLFAFVHIQLTIWSVVGILFFSRCGDCESKNILMFVLIKQSSLLWIYFYFAHGKQVTALSVYSFLLWTVHCGSCYCCQTFRTPLIFGWYFAINRSFSIRFRFLKTIQPNSCTIISTELVSMCHISTEFCAEQNSSHICDTGQICFIAVQKQLYS